MPCAIHQYYDRPRVDYTRRYIDQIARLTALLCSACAILTKLDFNFQEHNGLDEFWANHQEEDRKRIEAENARKLKEEYIAYLLKKSISELSKADIKMLRRAGHLS